MKQFFLLIITLFFTTYTLNAQNDASAKKVLDAVSAKVKSFKAISGKFILKNFSSSKKLVGTKTGTIAMKGNKYNLKQGKTEVICDGIKTYTYDGNKTITVDDADVEERTLTPQKLLSGSYDKDFTYKLISAKDKFNVVELKPIDKRKNFNKVTLYIDKTKSFISKATILDKSNNTLEFSFSNLNTNATLSDKIFVFDKSKYPKDVEVLD